MYCITKWTKAITDSGKDEYTGKLASMKKKYADKYGKEPPELYDFRLLDDDGEIYAYGKSTRADSFAPLDKYAAWYGCCDIQYKNPKTGKYETL